MELRTATSVPRSIQHIEKDLRNKTTSEFRTVLDSPLGVPNSQAPLYMYKAMFVPVLDDEDESITAGSIVTVTVTLHRQNMQSLLGNEVAFDEGELPVEEEENAEGEEEGAGEGNPSQVSLGRDIHYTVVPP